MGSISEFRLPIRLFLQGYRWRIIDPIPWQPLSKPLAECRLALVSTAGLVLPDQEPFDPKVRGGDFSYREIPADARPDRLIDTQKSRAYDHQGVRADPNLALPVERAAELAEAGEIGSVNRRHLSFMGSITAPGRLIRRSAPEAAALLVEDEVDLALLTPV